MSLSELSRLFCAAALGMGIAGVVGLSLHYPDAFTLSAAIVSLSMSLCGFVVALLALRKL